MVKRAAILLAIGFLSPFVGQAAADTALTGAVIHTISGETLEKATLLISGDRIAAVGAGIPIPEDVEIVDLSGLHLYPSLIDAQTSLGLVEIGSVRGTVDTDEVGSWNPGLRAEVSINPDSELLPVARAGGILIALVVPRGGTLSGRSALIRLDGWTWEEMTVHSSVAMHLRWPSMRIDRSPQAVVKASEQEEAIASRLAEVRETFDRARAYRSAIKAGERPGGPFHDRVLAFDAVLPVIDRSLPLVIHAGDRREIAAALDFAREESVRVILAGGAELAEEADRLAKQGVPAIVNPIVALPGSRSDPYDTYYACPARLANAGVLFCFSSGGGASNVRNLPHEAGMAVAYGLDPGRALSAITLDAARILGVEDRYGSLEPGKEATLLATDGDPLEIGTRVVRAWIAGHEVSLASRHTRLYERYRSRPRP